MRIARLVLSLASNPTRRSRPSTHCRHRIDIVAAVSGQTHVKRWLFARAMLKQNRAVVVQRVSHGRSLRHRPMAARRGYPPVNHKLNHRMRHDPSRALLLRGCNLALCANLQSLSVSLFESLWWLRVLYVGLDATSMAEKEQSSTRCHPDRFQHHLHACSTWPCRTRLRFGGPSSVLQPRSDPNTTSAQPADSDYTYT